ncbi:MAG: hypothetical protein KA419_06850 [Acidobacteria bacterium]|nr:hypothetical protein [Acidobacteriota bacterium]
MSPILSRCPRFFLSALLATIFAPAVPGCGWMGPESVDELSFFSPEIIGEPDALPFFATPFSPFYTRELGQGAQPDFGAANLDEWDAFFQKKIPREAWSQLLYKAPLARLDALIFRLKGKKDAAETPGDDVFLAYPDRKALVAALYYVGFAKRVEPYATERSDYWDWEEKKGKIDRAAREAAVAALAEGGTKALNAATDPFLRRRYAFQLLRLHFYHDAYDRCTAFYEERRATDFSDTSTVSWRALGYCAGAHYRAKRYAEANYRFSRLFDQCKPLRLSAAWSFRPQEEADWRGCLALAKNGREKAVLWQLLGISHDGLRAMKEIYALDPTSDLLPLLLVREVNRAELAANLTESLEPPEVAVPAPLSDLLAFVVGTAEKGDALKPWLWDLAAGHLQTLAGKPESAGRFLDRAAKGAPDTPLLRRQLRLCRAFAAVRALKAVDPAAEPLLARELTWAKAERSLGTEPSRTGAFFAWAKSYLSSIYRAKGDRVTALCLNDVPDDPFYLDSANVDRLLAFLEKPGKSDFEAFTAGEYGIGPTCSEDPGARSDLVQVKALNALYAGKYDEAETLFASVDTGELYADPFEIHLRDNHDRDANRKGHETYTKTQAVKKLAGLLRQAATDKAKAPELYFEAANALYNFSWYGNGREMYVTPREHVKHRPGFDDCSRAEALYRKAMDLSPDREFKAKACFMAAKCEQNAYYNRDPDKKSGDFIAGKWYKVLKDTFSDTKYYQEVLRECGYFRSWATKRPGE